MKAATHIGECDLRRQEGQPILARHGVQQPGSKRRHGGASVRVSTSCTVQAVLDIFKGMLCHRNADCLGHDCSHVLGIPKATRHTRIGAFIVSAERRKTAAAWPATYSAASATSSLFGWYTGKYLTWMRLYTCKRDPHSRG